MDSGSSTSCCPGMTGGKQQTRIAIRIEPVTRRDRVRVSLLHRLEPAERRHQHEECRARQMEVGEHQIDRTKSVARRDENRGLAGKWLDDATLVRRAFKQTQRCGP